VCVSAGCRHEGHPVHKTLHRNPMLNYWGRQLANSDLPGNGYLNNVCVCMLVFVEVT